MFRPELKNTAWESSPEVIFEITGENYQESSRLYRRYYEVERKDGTKVLLSEPSFDYSIEEEQVSTLINDSLMDIIWDAMTISELEAHFKNSISDWNSGDYQFRLELDSDLIFGWVHYKNKNKINTFRFKIDAKGGFSKC